MNKLAHEWQGNLKKAQVHSRPKPSEVLIWHPRRRQGVDDLMISWNTKQPFINGFFQLDDSQSLHRKLLFGVPG